MPVLLASLLSCLSACLEQTSGPAMATREECVELRAIEARITVQAARSAGDTPATAAELARHEKSLAAVGGEESLVRCMKERTVASIECAREAKTLLELESCARK